MKLCQYPLLWDPPHAFIVLCISMPTSVSPRGWEGVHVDMVICIYFIVSKPNQLKDMKKENLLSFIKRSSPDKKHTVLFWYLHLSAFKQTHSLPPGPTHTDSGSVSRTPCRRREGGTLPPASLLSDSSGDCVKRGFLIMKYEMLHSFIQRKRTRERILSFK